MPLEHRRRLADTVEDFQKLPRDQREALESLDRHLQGLPVETRLQLEATLKRYALWLESLTPEQRDALARLPTSERTNLIQHYLAMPRPVAELPTPPIFTQSPRLTPISLFEEAFLLRTWFRLTPNEKAQVDQVESVSEKIRQLERLAVSKRVFRDFSPIREDLDALKRDLQTAPPKERWAKLLKPSGVTVRVLRRAEARYVANATSEPVAADELIQFESRLPSWIRESSQALPPEVARPRLILMYRLVFGPSGMPEDILGSPKSSPSS
jgi:hypothetical protein